MQTLTIGRSCYLLAPTRDVGALQSLFAQIEKKINGKSRPAKIRDTRTVGDFPKFKPGMSTADYVKLYANPHLIDRGTRQLGHEHGYREEFTTAPFFAPLNDAPCTLYTGADTHETLPDGFTSWEEFDAAQTPVDLDPVDMPTIAPESAPVAPIEPAAPVATETVADARGAAVVPAPVYAPDVPMADPADIGAAVRRGLDRQPIAHLPLFARVAIERLDADSGMRNSASLASMLDAYARTYGTAPDDSTRASAHYIAGRRFWDFDAAPNDAHGAAGCAKREGIEPAAQIEAADQGPVDTPIQPADVAPPGYAYPGPLATYTAPAGRFAGMTIAELRAYLDGCHADGDYSADFEDAARELNDRTGGPSLPPIERNGNGSRMLPARCTYGGIGPVYRAHCATSDTLRALDADPVSVRGLRMLRMYRGTAANELRARLAAAVRSDRLARRPLPADTAPLPVDTGAGLAPLPGESDAAPSIEPDVFIRRATKAERMGNAPRQRAMRSIVPMAGHTAMFKPYGHKGAGFYWVLDRAAPVADPVPGDTQPAAPVAKPRDGGMSMLQTILHCLQRSAPGGVPDYGMLEREAARLSGVAERMRESMPGYSATCADVARSLRDLAEVERARLAPAEPAALDGLDVSELGADGLAEFDALQAAPYVEITDAGYCDPGPVLRIPASDPRLRIPARFAPGYCLRA